MNKDLKKLKDWFIKNNLFKQAQELEKEELEGEEEDFEEILPSEDTWKRFFSYISGQEPEDFNPQHMVENLEPEELVLIDKYQEKGEVPPFIIPSDFDTYLSGAKLVQPPQFSEQEWYFILTDWLSDLTTPLIKNIQAVGEDFGLKNVESDLKEYINNPSNINKNKLQEIIKKLYSKAEWMAYYLMSPGLRQSPGEDLAFKSAKALDAILGFIRHPDYGVGIIDWLYGNLLRVGFSDGELVSSLNKKILKHLNQKNIKTAQVDPTKYKWEEYFRRLTDQNDYDKPFDMQKVFDKVEPEELVEWDHLAEQGLVPRIVNDPVVKGKMHYLNEKLHRRWGPAIEFDDGRGMWYLDGKPHRLNGPAKQLDDGGESWWLNGKRHREGGPAELNPDGTRVWWYKGKLHREDGPAYIDADGDKEWYRHGIIHREDGPAIEWSNGVKEWYINGKLHREDGPAWEFPEGKSRYYLDGKEYSKEDWEKLTGK